MAVESRRTRPTQGRATTGAAGAGRAGPEEEDEQRCRNEQRGGRKEGRTRRRGTRSDTGRGGPDGCLSHITCSSTAHEFPIVVQQLRLSALWERKATGLRQTSRELPPDAPLPLAYGWCVRSSLCCCVCVIRPVPSSVSLARSCAGGMARALRSKKEPRMPTCTWSRRDGAVSCRPPSLRHLAVSLAILCLQSDLTEPSPAGGAALRCAAPASAQVDRSLVAQVPAARARGLLLLAL